MNQDDLIRQIMAEVMKNLGGNDQVASLGIVAEGDQAEASCGLAGDQGEGLGIGEQAGQVGAGLVEAVGQCVAQSGLGEKAQAHELPADDLPGPGLFAQGDVELVGADQAQGDQGLTDGLMGVGVTVHGDGSWAVRVRRRAAPSVGLKRAGLCAASAKAWR